MKHTHLISYMGFLVVPEMAQALQTLEKVVFDTGGWKLVLDGPEAGLEADNPLSLIPGGREIHVHLEKDGVEDEQAKLDALWGFMIPHGFTPYQRYPLVKQPLENVFYFLGSWKFILDRLMSEGRGHLAWPPLCAAIQTDVGVWEGVNADQHFVQGQLHRINKNVGPVDGVIGSRTVEAIDSLGLKNSTFTDVQAYLRSAKTLKAPMRARTTGHIAISGWDLKIAPFGDIKTIQTPQGATLTIDGPGRIIVDISD